MSKAEIGGVERGPSGIGPTPAGEWLREGHVDCVSCPVCAFTFDACHEDQGGGYSCPLCAEVRLIEQLESANAEIAKLRRWFGMTEPASSPASSYDDLVEPPEADADVCHNDAQSSASSPHPSSRCWCDECVNRTPEFWEAQSPASDPLVSDDLSKGSSANLSSEGSAERPDGGVVPESADSSEVPVPAMRQDGA